MELRSPVRTSLATIIAVASLPLFGQDRASFEAASIKAGDPHDPHSGWHSMPGYMVIQNQTLRGLIRIAYHLNDSHVTGGEKWVDTDRFEVEARAGSPLDEKDMLPMLQTLLADRFKLALHKERKLFPGYALTIAKSGLKIQPVEPGRPGSSSRGRDTVQIELRQAPLSRLAEVLTRQLQVPVQDETGATEVFSFKLEYAPQDLSANAAPNDKGETVFTALQALGLRLESRKVLEDMLVIDQSAKPDGN